MKRNIKDFFDKIEVFNPNILIKEKVVKHYVPRTSIVGGLTCKQIGEKYGK